MRTTKLADGAEIPLVGQGTWLMGVRLADSEREVAALRLGLDLGMTLIDTAEMYSNGHAEEVVARAIEGRRDEVFLVSKVLPTNASRAGTVRACERSLARLEVERLDLYLLHWESDHPLEETLAAFDDLLRAGKIARFGVSNFDERRLARTLAIAGGERCAANQVLYNLARRGIEWALLPEHRERGVLTMAYSPLDEMRPSLFPKRADARRRALETVAARHDVTPAQVAIAWTIRERGVVTIPKAVDPKHVRENAAAANLTLSPQDSIELDAAFPPPDGPSELEMI
jgi:diketogulonate reductase-like aldo/keto reductase